eukprot:299864_1
MAISQTQTLQYSFEDDTESEPWGRLCPTSTSMEYPVFELHEETTKFGRDTSSVEIELTEPQISSIHTEIIRNLNYGVDGSGGDSHHCGSIRDLSTNGTYLNKRKIGKNKTSLLFDGDEIQFIQYCKFDRKTGKERNKVSFLFYATRNVNQLSNSNSIFAKYDLRKTLGTGSFAVVKLGICRETGERYAIKEIDKKKYELKSKSRKKNTIMNEANILQQINHKNIIKVYDVFDENNTLYIVLEMAFGGELFERIIKEKKLNENIARYIMKQLLSSIMYLHDHKIAHRDLKPENILMKENKSWDIKITDFGLSRLLEYDAEMLTTMCGTPLFLAPEVLTSKKSGGYGFEVDYWSIGVILYLMLVGHPPYNEKEGNLLDLVKNHKFSFPNQTWSKISSHAKDLVINLMNVNPEKRYGGQQVLNHPWMNIESNTNDINNTNNNKKRKIDDNNDSKQEEKQEPPRKKYKTNHNLMSMDSIKNISQLTPFDSMIDKNEPKKIKNNGIKLGGDDVVHFGDDDNHNDANGNGASFVLKNSVSMKEMSLD